MPETKCCTDCKGIKNIDDFYFVNAKNMHMSRCKECYSVHRKETSKRYRDKNKEVICAKISEYRKNNKHKRNEYYAIQI